MTDVRSREGSAGFLGPRVPRADGWIAAALFLAALAYFGGTLHRTLDLRDEGYLLYDIRQTAEGRIAHRDFVALYGPGVYGLNAALFRAFGGEVMPIRWSIAGLRALAVAIAYLMARHLAARPFALIAAFLAIAYWGRVIWNLNAPYAAVYTIPLCMLSALLLLRARATAAMRTYALAGLASGAALVFKQSLGSASIFGLSLAICAVAALESCSGPRGTRARAAMPFLLVLWAGAGLALLVPFRGLIGPWDYLLHFLPIHLLLVWVGLRFARAGDPAAFITRVTPRLVAFGLGAFAVPGVVALLYARWGALGKLLYQMFVFPRDLQNYYEPIDLPPLAGAATLLALVAAPSAALVWRGGRRKLALGLLAGAAAAAGLAYAAASSLPFIAIVSLPQMNGVLPALIAYLVLAFLSLERRAPPSGVAVPAVGAVVTALLLQLMMAFQIFPRGTYNLTMMLGTIAPLLAYLLQRWSALARESAPASAPGKAVVATIAVLPLCLAAPMAYDSVPQMFARPPYAMGMHFPATAGIEPKPRAYRSQDLRTVEWLIDHVHESEPADAPLFVLTNEYMIPFLSPREGLFGEYSYYLHLFGWDMLPRDYAERLDVAGMLARLEREPDPIIVDKDDFAAFNLRRFLPELGTYIDEHFFVEYRIGSYRVLRRKNGVAAMDPQVLVP